MMRKTLYILIFILLLISVYFYNANLVTPPKLQILEIYPAVISPGDPIILKLNTNSTPIKALFDKKEIKVLKYDNFYLGLVGIDLKEGKKDHIIDIELINGFKIFRPIILSMKSREEKPLGIPDSLGGNTQQAGQKLLDNISKENASINNIKLDTESFWQNSKFSSPLKILFITDEYGYSRNTVGYSIAHKGTDFRASEGTEVMTINKGIVRIARSYTLSGNTIVIDHGAGLVTIYMHLSKLNVKEGDSVESGQVIGLSGKTGYVLGAHLHLAIKINGISIDPAKFLKYFGVL